MKMLQFSLSENLLCRFKLTKVLLENYLLEYVITRNEFLNILLNIVFIFKYFTDDLFISEINIDRFRNKWSIY